MSGEKVHPLEWQHFEEDTFRKDDPTRIYAKFWNRSAVPYSYGLV